jgi:hypothetical protein
LAALGSPPARLPWAGPDPYHLPRGLGLVQESDGGRFEQDLLRAARDLIEGHGPGEALLGIAADLLHAWQVREVDLGQERLHMTAGQSAPRLQLRPGRHVGQPFMGLRGDPFDRKCARKLAGHLFDHLAPQALLISDDGLGRVLQIPDDAGPRTGPSVRKKSDRIPTSENP